MIDPITTAVIADDEPALSNYMVRQLRDAWPDLKIVGVAENGLQAQAFIQQYRPDVAFLDIKMPGMSGLEVAASVQGACHIVFVTAFDDYAIDAFEAEALDYIVKPVMLKRLLKTVAKIQKQLQIQETPTNLQGMLKLLQQHAANREFLKWVRASVRDEVRVIDVDDVLYFQSADKYTSVVTNKKTYIVRSPLKELESQLDPEKFWRIHRGTLLAVSSIQTCKKDMSGKMSIELQGHDAKLPVSRAFQHLFKLS